MRFQRAVNSACLALALCPALRSLAQVPRHEYPGKAWTVVAPETLGWSGEGLRAADEVAKTLGTDAYLVIHKGQIVHEFGECSRASNVHSVRKSILSILFGIYVDKGAIGLDRTLADLCIDDKDRLTDAEKSATVRQLLQARSGIYHPSAYWSKASLESLPPRGTYSPGEVFRYNNWDFNALGSVFNSCVKKSVFDCLQQDLAGPLQFEDFVCVRDTKWVYDHTLSEHPAYEMRLSARDLGRIGLLMARRGRWNGRQVISERWFNESTTSWSSDTGNGGIGYGYLWWIGLNGIHFGQRLPPPVFSARGNYGQFLVVAPACDLVIVHRVNSDKPGHAKVGNGEFGKLFGKILSAGPNLASAGRD